MHLYCFKDLVLYQLHKLKIILKLLVLHQYKTDPNLTIQAFSGENVSFYKGQIILFPWAFLLLF